MGIAVFSAVFVGVETVVGWVLGSLVIYLVAKLLSGRGTPRAALSVFGFAMLPTVAQNVVRAVQGLATGSIPTAGLTDAFPKVTAPVLKVALSTINIFGLWGAVLMVLAVSAAFGMSRKKSALMMACFWAIGFAFQVVVTGAAARIGGA
jgi:hypothetical protein